MRLLGEISDTKFIPVKNFPGYFVNENNEVISFKRDGIVIALKTDSSINGYERFRLFRKGRMSRYPQSRVYLDASRKEQDDSWLDELDELPSDFVYDIECPF